MNILFDTLKAIYQKSRLPSFTYDVQMCITLSKLFSLDSTETYKVRKLVEYLFWLEPKHYIYLLYFHISKKLKPPFLNYPKKAVMKENLLFTKVQYILKWSDREMKANKEILELILKDEKYWKKELGVK